MPMPFDLLATARQIIRIDTRSQVSTAPAVSFLEPLCRQAGLDVTALAEERDGIEQFDLLARRGPPTADALLLGTHLDTVPPGDASLWTETGGDPFALTRRGGLLYGLGAADVKLDFLCRLAALERLSEVPLRRGVVLAGTYGEETGRYGADLLVRELRPLPRTVLVGEPTDLRPVISHKGYLEVHVEAADLDRAALPDAPLWQVVFEGVSAHSSQPHLGRSAVDACLGALAAQAAADSGAALEAAGAGRVGSCVVEIIGGEVPNKVADTCIAVMVGEDPSDLPGAASVGPLDESSVPVRECSSPRTVALLLAVHSEMVRLRDRLAGVTAAEFDPPYSTVNAGIVRLAEGRLHYVADIRRIPGDTAVGELEEGLSRMAEIVEGLGSGLGATARRLLEAPPFATSGSSPLLGALQEELRLHGLPSAPAGKSGTTEASVYQAAGMDTVIFGPGTATGNIHRPNEHVRLDALHRAVDVYEGLIRRLCT